jgi:phosphoglycerate dehydrogenase-like enzyme
LGNGEVPEEELIATDADAIIADAVRPVSAKVIESMPRLRLVQSQGWRIT